MKILTSVVNNPEFINIQYHSFKKYMKTDYEFIVFNDAKVWKDYSNFYDNSVKYKIEETCKILGIKYINIPNGHHKYQKEAYLRTADSMKFMTDFMFKKSR